MEELVKKFNVSERTIRYDLENIDSFLAKNGLNSLEKKTKVEIKIQASEEEKKKLKLLLTNFNLKSYILSTEERRDFILLELFHQKNYITINELADILLVSRGTVVNDIKLVREWLNQRHITLNSSPRHGLKIVGNEKYIRKAIVELIRNKTGLAVNLDNLLAILNLFKDRSNNILDFLLKTDELSFFENLLKETEKKLNRIFSDKTFYDLLIYLGISITRINLGKDLILSDAEYNKIKITQEFKIAEKLVKEIEKFSNVYFSCFETAYIASLFLQGEVTKSNNFLSENWVDLQLLTIEFLKDMSLQIDEDLTNDQQLFQSIITHLAPAIYRIKRNETIKNQLLNEIKENYSYIYNVVKSSLSKILKEKFDLEISDDEIGFFTIHVATALERRKKFHLRLNALLVCGTGSGTVKLLETKLNNNFDINIVNTVSYHEVSDSLQNQDIDIIISTIDLFNLNLPVPYFKVNLFFNDEETVIFKQKLDELLIQKKKKQRKVNFNENKRVFIQQRNINKDSIQVNQNKIDSLSNKGDVEPLLRDLLTENTIQLNVEANDWKEAIKIGGQLLLNNGSIEEEYIDAMIQTVNDYGPYIVIAPGIALAHAKPEMGVKKIGLSMITLKNPVKFGHAKNDPVDIVISLSAIDHYTHLKALSEMTNLLDDKTFLEVVKKATEKSEILKYINDD